MNNPVCCKNAADANMGYLSQDASHVGVSFCVERDWPVTQTAAILVLSIVGLFVLAAIL